jgi:general secretion pathway protein H
MQLPSARLRRTATMLSSAIRVAFTRTTATSRNIRLVMDIDQKKMWLEETSVPMLVQSKDVSGAAGAKAVSDAERNALAESDRIMKGPEIPKPEFHPIEAMGFGVDSEGKGGKPLPRDIEFRQIQVSHDENPRTSGRDYLYFWPGGMTEQASIQIRIGDSEDDSRTLTLLVKPLTGQVTVKAGPVDLQLPTDDATASDRQDNGF